MLSGRRKNVRRRGSRVHTAAGDSCGAIRCHVQRDELSARDARYFRSALVLAFGIGLHTGRCAALGTGGRSTAATRGERAGGALRLGLPFVVVSGGCAPIYGLRGAQSIQVGLGLRICHGGESGNAERSEHKGRVRSSSEVDRSQPDARALVPRGVGGHE
jgi:hypothetical protein